MMNKFPMMSKVLLLSFFLLGASSSLYAASVKEAQKLEQQGELSLAIAEWKKLASQAPDNASYLYHIGRLYHAMGKQQEAKMYLLHSLSLNPKDVDTRVELGYVYYDLKDLPNAKDQFEQVLKDYPRDSDAKNGLLLVGREELGKSHPKLAAEHSEEEIKLMGYADKVEKRRQYQQALAIWMKLDADHPYDAIYLYRIGRLYHAMDKEKLAEDYLTRSLQIDPNNADAKVVLGYVYYDLEMNAKAKALFREVLADDPNYEGAKKGLQLIKSKEMNAKSR